VFGVWQKSMRHSDETSNIVSVSWSDHLIFGEGEGKLDTVTALRKGMQRWKTDLGANIVHWRCRRDRIAGKTFASEGYRHFYKTLKPDLGWDDFVTVAECARKLELKVFLYVSLFDEGWPLLPKKIRETSYHNKMHCQHVSWQSDFSRSHPDYVMVDRTGKRRQWGVMCLGYPEVRRHFIHRYCRLLKSGQFDGVFVCLRSQSKPAEFADQYGFNDPVRKDYLIRYGRDILAEDFNLQQWRDLQGEYLTHFLMELRKELTATNTSLALGIPRGDVIGPPLGNTTLNWKAWVKHELIDHLIIDQNSSKCPSMWHDLWPMHRGYGFLQNYLDGTNMKSLQEDLTNTYQPALSGQKTKLFVARQWHGRSALTEQALLKRPWVNGLVFSSFRHDNPGPVRRNQWKA
jgi:hypothetical protein